MEVDADSVSEIVEQDKEPTSPIKDNTRKAKSKARAKPKSIAARKQRAKRQRTIGGAGSGKECTKGGLAISQTPHVLTETISLLFFTAAHPSDASTVTQWSTFPEWAVMDQDALDEWIAAGRLEELVEGMPSPGILRHPWVTYIGLRDKTAAFDQGTDEHTATIGSDHADSGTGAAKTIEKPKLIKASRKKKRQPRKTDNKNKEMITKAPDIATRGKKNTEQTQRPPPKKARKFKDSGTGIEQTQKPMRQQVALQEAGCRLDPTQEENQKSLAAKYWLKHRALQIASGKDVTKTMAKIPIRKETSPHGCSNTVTFQLMLLKCRQGALGKKKQIGQMVKDADVIWKNNGIEAAQRYIRNECICLCSKHVQADACTKDTTHKGERRSRE